MLLRTRRLSDITKGSVAFAKRESAFEERYIHQHEIEVIRKLKEELAHHESILLNKISKGASLKQPNLHKRNE